MKYENYLMKFLRRRSCLGICYIQQYQALHMLMFCIVGLEWFSKLVAKKIIWNTNWCPHMFLCVCRWTGYFLHTGSHQSNGHPHWTSWLKVWFFSSTVFFFFLFYFCIFSLCFFLIYCFLIASVSILFQCDKGVESAPWLDEPVSIIYCGRRKRCSWTD